MRGDLGAAVGLTLVPADLFWALGSLCNLQRLPFDASLLARAYPPPHTLGTLLEALRALGCEATLDFARSHRLGSLPMPCVVMLSQHRCAPNASETSRPALLVRAEHDRVLYFAAGASTPTVATLGEFEAIYDGVALVVTRPDAVDVERDAGPRVAFGFRWFVPEIARHRRIWKEVLAASLAIQLLALVLPLLSQVIIDKVIVHRATSTLAIIAAALVAIVLFSSALTWIRQYLVLHTGTRIDAVLGTAIFRHLTSLPLRYFERRPTGVLTARLAGIESIREFLTGAAVTLALDIPFLIVFIAVMLVYSVPLTLLTLAVVALLVIASAVAAPLLQRRFDAQFLAGARAQAFVTEHLAAIETVKSLELEPALRLRYDRLLAQYLATGFSTRQVSNAYQTVAGALEQLLSAAILCAGAWLVMTSPDFTIGMLVAFQMFAARVSQPLLRLTGLWQQFQQAAIAVKRLADVMDVPPEPHSILANRSSRGPGRIELAGVGFRYATERPWLYRNLSFAFEPGECVVVTGPSGCGKSTLFKLLLGFALPVEGAVRIDGRDTRTLAANELRSHFGVVPQETTLFSGTLLDNLQLGNALASFEQVVQACKVVDVHATVEALRDGYRSEVGERGVGLSGGQKQRLALARALLRKPQVLLLDEPFSQLDDEAASKIAAAVSRLKGKLTIVIASHQLPATLAYDRRIELKPE
ncbi:MAG TPA: peptidase domain-containing ABC transporter [Casimicrobiaceae bacterium]|nr:peptidase domain-containing ABC transporter [Casimicrobiaceae bacterium]